MPTKEEIIQCYDDATNLLITKGWTQGSYARDAIDEPVPDYHPAACSYCLVGAMCCAWNKIKGKSLPPDFVFKPLYLAIEKKYKLFVPSETPKPSSLLFKLNDEYLSSKEEVIELYKLAKELI